MRAGRRTGVEHDASAARRRQLAGKEQAEAAQTTGDEIGAVGPGRADLFGGHHGHAFTGTRHIEHHFSGVPGSADQTNGNGSVVNGIVRGLRHRQRALDRVLVDGFQQAPDGVRVAVCQQRQVDGIQRQVAAEREQPEPSVAVDVTFADLHESPAKGQQFDPSTLCGAGQRVEYDVDTIPIGVASDLLGELGAP
ncbi:Uncharacterised protein [Mycobacterium tuberculosis]|uniref:Uncharacterized protein n=1 Tax=Mycobacterium tuberculosis TaxID=1773 RepID=A0A655FVB8_MYCTX|nr:Uncharacterised protein [Mycobacterium tuberculosis]CNU05877.1 Uncharacterised protein [Mycobacterium tuberculosis]CNU91552.1 Uncharacterised protein [Mycobacterium tuberculosis]CNV33304.1 Uncharacterised protein [Mycobacterium tuberculosis]CNV41062.1 Uncharacterised protein [Mycobacterium tuberculosis]